jgi:hypothetical protein
MQLLAGGFMHELSVDTMFSPALITNATGRAQVTNRSPFTFRLNIA